MNTRIITWLAGATLLGKITKKSLNTNYLRGKVVLITGGSKGLGVTLAEHLIKEEAKIAICARDEDELKNAKAHLEGLGGEVFAQVCDVVNKDEVGNLICLVIDHFGTLDVVVNNAGIIDVGPMESFNYQQYENAMNIMYWGVVNSTFGVLPYFKKRRQGHIVNITSIGGKVSVPHLLPYNSAKFAAVGFSEGSAAELKKDNITVTTIVPWLMRTGSYVNAYFQENNKKEFKLFSFMSTAPLLTLNADRAAAKIIKAIKEKRSLKTLGVQARLAMEFDHFFPNLSTKIFGLVARFIPARHEPTHFEKGKDITEREPDAELPGVRALGEKAQREHQELR